MFYPLLAIVLGIAVLVVGADRFVAGAAAIARLFGLSPLLIGMVIVGFGTSTPEMIVSATSSLQGSTDIALGNAYGSNITNILLILGVCAIIHPLKAAADAVKRELPILLFVTAVTFAFLWDGVVSRVDAIIMLIIFVGCLGFSIRQSRASGADAALPEEEAAPGAKMSPFAALVWIAIGLGLMMGSSYFLVWGAVAVAQYFGVSELVIGLTVVAVGTSLPELASSIVASFRGEDDIALGNIIGSNVFNSLVVVGIAGLISPLGSSPELFSRDLPVMAATTVLLYIFCRSRPSPGLLTRGEGAVLFGGYVAYTAYLI
ncbi:MAG: calcium/sodium antiporter, partial [Planctomycetota bacterium]|nr:calcium/sodium antiporter [Planctomycetota bacterium]